MNHSCPVCFTWFSSQEDLLNHISIQHNGETENIKEIHEQHLKLAKKTFPKE